MAIDPSIALSVAPTPNMGPSLSAGLTGAQAQWNIYGQQQAAQSQNALRAILSQPGAMDAQGKPTGNALKAITAIDPNIAAKFTQNALAMQQTQIQTEGMKSKLFQQKQSMKGEVAEQSLVAYEEAIKRGLPEAEARNAAQGVYSEGYDRLVKSGLFSEQEQASAPRQFDPLRVRASVQTFADWRAQQTQEATTARQVRAEARDETHLGLEQQRVDLEAKRIADAANKPNAAADAERDAMIISNEKIAAEEKKRGVPLSEAEKAEFRQQSRISSKVESKRQITEAASPPGALTDDAARFAAQEYLRTGTMPLVGRDKNTRAQIVNAAAKIANDEGRDVSDYLAGRATLKADAASLGALTKQKNAAEGYERGAAKALDLVVKMVPKSPEPLNMQLLTRWARSGETQFGDVKVPEYQAQLVSALDQYAKVLSGATGAQASTDSARNLALSLIPEGASSKQVAGIVEVLKKDMQLKIDGYNEQIQSIQDGIKGGGKPESNKPESGKPAQTQKPEPTKPPDDVATPTSKAEYDALPSGAHYRKPGDAPGAWRTKP